MTTGQLSARANSILRREPPIGTAIVGYGYWGPNLARNIAECPELRLEALCDLDPASCAIFNRRHPDARAVSELDAVLVDPAIEAVVIATPPQTHHALAKRALEAGKHVLVEKPLATRLEDAYELADVAAANERVLMPGHTFIYSPAVNTVRDLIRERRDRRRALRHLLAHEPRQVQRGRRCLRPGSARPLDPSLLA